MNELLSNDLISAYLKVLDLPFGDSSVAHAGDRGQPPNDNDAFSSATHKKMPVQEESHPLIFWKGTRAFDSDLGLNLSSY